MVIEFSLSNIDLVAVYAALLSTLIAIWELFKWKSRHKLKISVSAKMKLVPSTEDNSYVLATAVNRGEFPTTITNLGLYYWPQKPIFFKRRKELESFIVKTDSVPQMINPGQEWQAYFIQTKEIEKMAKNGFLYIVVFHSMGKEIIKRVIL